MQKVKNPFFFIVMILFAAVLISLAACQSGGGNDNNAADDDDSGADDDSGDDDQSSDDDNDTGAGADDDSGNLDCNDYTADAADPPGACGIHRDSPLPALTGPYCVGTVIDYWVDESRDETFTPADPNDKRELMVQIWYPADPDLQGDPAPYVSPQVADWVRTTKLPTDPPLPSDWASQFVPYAVYEAPFTTVKKKFPLVIFSPGLTMNQELYTAFLEGLASRGYVVVGIDHPYISGLTVFPDGTEIEGTHHYLEPWLRSANKVTTADVRFVLDQLTAMNSPDADKEDFRCRFDLDKPGVFGHSFGGSASAEVCLVDSRFRAGADMDGSIWGDAVQQGTDRPFLMLLSENSFQTDSTMQTFWSNLHGPGLRGDITGALHGNFSDVGLIYNAFCTVPPPTDFELGSIDAMRAVYIVNETLRAFFDINLKGADPNLYMDELLGFEEVTWTQK